LPRATIARSGNQRGKQRLSAQTNPNVSEHNDIRRAHA